LDVLTGRTANSKKEKRDLRIVLVGAQGTGKTTLAERLARELSLPLIPESSREVARKNGIDHLSQLSVDGFAKFYKLCIESQLEHESRHHSFVSDRCTLDGAVYWLKWLSCVRSPEETEQYVNLARGNMINYHYVFYLPIEFPPPMDGFRSTHQGYQQDIDSCFLRILQDWGVTYHQLMGGVKERLNTALKLLHISDR
jgi:nicotinamide riboside kinase